LKAPEKISKVTVAGVLISLGIVYGDIGTSPLYVMRAIINNAGAVNTDFILGALSCIIWTLTLLTTVKYILIALNADNKGEGGIFSLFALIRRRAPLLYIVAIIGGSTLLADGVITPAITVVSAVEGLDLVYKGINVVPIALIIIAALFIVQQFGTKVIGGYFGPIMFIWFGTLGVLGASHAFDNPVVFKAFNPYYAYEFLTQFPGGFILLGAVFLAVTGAEALYSDLGHCGKNNIRVSWIFVKCMLILNYLGQGSWILSNPKLIVAGINPFFSIIPHWFILPGVAIATMAAIIASQALISGSYTLISEAMSLNFWPRIKINYPTILKGQMYISSINWILFAACSFVILFFRKSSNMEAAYGLSITITMLMTTTLLAFYLHFIKKVHIVFVSIFVFTFITIESGFLIANLHKFPDGGWFTLLLAGCYFIVMFTWFNAQRYKNRMMKFVKLADNEKILCDLSKDITVPKYATNLVYFSRAALNTEIEAKIIYSILHKQPKRADIYWFIHIDNHDDPNVFEYKVTQVVPDCIIRVDFRLGFKVPKKINLYFKQVLNDMANKGELDIHSRYISLRKHNILSDFKFVILDRVMIYDLDFSPMMKFVLTTHELIKRLCPNEVRTYGLDTSSVELEKVPLEARSSYAKRLKRLN
jgi:KUP system potassium uptake protein